MAIFCNISSQNYPESRIIINVSPIDYGHVLLVPDYKSCHPQVISLEGDIISIAQLLLNYTEKYRS